MPTWLTVLYILQCAGFVNYLEKLGMYWNLNIKIPVLNMLQFHINYWIILEELQISLYNFLHCVNPGLVIFYSFQSSVNYPKCL